MTNEEAIRILMWVFYKIRVTDSENIYDTPPTEEEIKQAGSMAIEALGQEPKIDATLVSKPNLGDNVVYGTDGNLYKITASSGKEYEQDPCDNCKYLDGDGCRLLFEHIEYGKASNDCPSDDCVRRQMVIEQTYNWSKDEFLRVTNPFDYLRKRIKSLPPVNPQPKRGHWIDVDGDNARCGCCNCLNHLYGTYCKHCGAKMIESQEGK